MDISNIIVRINNKIDRQKTLEKFEGYLDNYIAEELIENSIILEAVNSVFDKFKGETISMSAVLAYSTNYMNATPDNFTILSGRISKFIKNNAKGDQSLFIISTRGIKRRADHI